MTITMPNGKLKMVVDYLSKAACEQDIPDVEASQYAYSGHCDPGLPDTTSLSDLQAEACPSPAPTTMQDWEKRHAVLVQVCAGVEIDCGNLTRENVGCYEGNYRLLPPACRAALIELGCTTRGIGVAAKQEAEYQALASDTPTALLTRSLSRTASRMATPKGGMPPATVRCICAPGNIGGHTVVRQLRSRAMTAPSNNGWSVP